MACRKGKFYPLIQNYVEWGNKIYLLALQPPFLAQKYTFWSLDPRRDSRLSDEEISDFNPKTGEKKVLSEEELKAFDLGGNGTLTLVITVDGYDNTEMSFRIF